MNITEEKQRVDSAFKEVASKAAELQDALSKAKEELVRLQGEHRLLERLEAEAQTDKPQKTGDKIKENGKRSQNTEQISDTSSGAIPGG